MPPKPDRVPTALRRKVSQRANYFCEYCLCPDEFSPGSFAIDHIQPRALGGESVSKNLAWSCFGCNARKHAKTTAIDTQTAEVVSIFNPRQQTWLAHFQWSDDATLLLGKTPCGRATVMALALNRAGVVNLRRLLGAAGLHPPKVC